MSPSDVCETSFYTRPWDIDMFMEMNNGRIFTLYDLGRFDLSIRTGLATILKENNWGLVVAGSTIRYRKRVKLFDKVTMRSQLVGVDTRWFYIAQSMWVKGQPNSSALLRTGVTAKGKLIRSELVIKAMGNPDLPKLPDWVNAWIKSDTAHPWPPDKS